MADYTRMVAYIFEYDHDKKGKNIGFAKIESRSDQCRISINLRGTLGNRGGVFKVYIYTREKNKMIGIPIGEIIIRNGRGELKIVTPSKDIWEPGYSIDQMNGIVIINGTGDYVGTEWDDYPIDIKYFMPYSSKEKRSEENNDTQQQIETNQKMDKENENIKIWKDKNKQSKENTITEIEEIHEKKEVKIKEDSSTEKIEGNMEAVEKAGTIDRRAQSKEENWKYLLKTYPQISPFEDSNFAECIRIEPKDLVYLRKEDWALGNNSFLLHGYYSYRYLILGKRKNDDGYILGVPGVYHNKEYLMAKMFGFLDFIPAKKDEHKNAIFGYWCRRV